MATLEEQAKNLRKINVESEVSKALTLLDDILVDYNQGQLSDGRNNLGNLIGRYTKYTEAAALMSGISNKTEGDAYNFVWTGEFFKAFKAKQISGGVELTSGVSYLKDIQRLGSRNRAQDKLFGLSKENMQDFIQKVLLPKVNSMISIDPNNRGFFG